ncbi:hypothetical protein DPMN_009602 [Dreissena polymorpha]|uniref:Uncharacterized protein n=1 Tax=Dreissena polymorpha TaxID=45954 RepID=A0A9D4MX90_DREPO|nr:hypothetical protein DPMN_009602 [Dreissena polymorpha]
MFEIDIKLRTLRTVRSEKEGGLQSSSVVTMPRSELPVQTPNAPSAAVFHSSVKHPHSGVVLKTAIATVGIKETAADAAILFDEGSQKSFITQQLADQLHLRLMVRKC